MFKIVNNNDIDIATEFVFVQAALLFAYLLSLHARFSVTKIECCILTVSSFCNVTRSANENWFDLEAVVMSCQTTIAEHCQGH